MASSSGDGATCPNDPVLFTCTVNVNFLLWSVDPPPNHAVTDGFTRGVIGSNGIGPLPPSGVEGFMFQAALTATSSDSVTSTLTTLTEVSSLNGTTVSCGAVQTESLSITVAGELQKYTIHILMNASLSRAPISSTHFHCT